MAASVALVADAGRRAGLGHVSRSTGVAVALQFLGLETQCYAFGVEEPFSHDRVEWTPLPSSEFPACHVLVIDSYLLPQEALARAARRTRLVIMHDVGPIPPDAAGVVTPADTPSEDPSRLTGFMYAALRPGFWGLPPRELEASARHILVTTGGGRLAEFGEEVAHALITRLAESEVTVVAGPHGSIEASPGLKVLEAPRSLLEPLLAADIVVSAAGQTMLEAAAAGTPCIALVLAENQRRQAERLAGAGAAILVDPPSAEGAANAAAMLAQDVEARLALSREGQRAVDGYGALRVALAVARLAEEGS